MKKIFKLLLIGIIVFNQSIKAQDKYSPAIESLAKYETPEWFRDAKFGIFIHWGVYAVPAHSNEWYPRNMYKKDFGEYQHHLDKYGSHKQFGYKDFISDFKAENWDPVQWVDLFLKSGVKYVVPVAEHHDGFPMYDCSFTEYNSTKMGPKRDIVGELLKECKNKNLKAGVSSHRAYNWEFFAQEKSFDTYDPQYASLYGKRRTQLWPDKDFVNDWYLRTVELLVKYEPDILWFDFYVGLPEFHDARYRLASDYFNLSSEWKKDVVLQYKYDVYHPAIGLLDIERGKLSGIRREPWQTDTSVSFRSWCHIEGDNEYKSAQLIVHDLIDIVSKNGNLLLNIGPKADGTIPVEQQELLLGIGKWLKINGEAIYDTRPWLSFGEGPTKTAEGAHQERNNKAATSEDYRFTTNGDVLYATCMGWPDDNFVIKSLGKDALENQNMTIKKVSVLGNNTLVKWKQTSKFLKISRPDEQPCDHAYVIKIETYGLANQMARYEQSLPEEPMAIYCFPGSSLRGKGGYEVRDGKLFQWEKDTIIRWNIDIKEPGAYKIDVKQSNCKQERYLVTVNNQEFRNTDQCKEKKMQESQLGRVEFEKAGHYTVTMKADANNEWHKKLVLKQIKFSKIK